jgi:hypothetical protein
MPCSALREVSAYGCPRSGVSISASRTSISRPPATTTTLSPSSTRFTIAVTIAGDASATTHASSSTLARSNERERAIPVRQRL